MASKFGGVPVQEGGSKFGGVAVEESPPPPLPAPGVLDRIFNFIGSHNQQYSDLMKGVQGGYTPLEELYLGGMMPTPLGPPVGAALKGGVAAAKAAPTSKLGAIIGGGLGYGIGEGVGHPIMGTEAGAAIGGATPKIKAGFKGAVEGLKKYMAPTPGPREIPPVWQGMPEPTAAPLPDLSPIPGKLPSGRIPGKPQPIPPVEPVAAQPAAQPAGSPITGLHLPEVPAHYAGEPNPTAAFKNDQAVLAELRKVPGITQGTLTPEMVHAVRKALGQRVLKAADVERRVGHIRQMLPK